MPILYKIKWKRNNNIQKAENKPNKKLTFPVVLVEDIFQILFSNSFQFSRR